MKQYFEDVRGWIALGIFVVSLCVLGFTKMLTKHTNLTLIIIFAVSIIIMAILSAGAPKKHD